MKFRAKLLIGSFPSDFCIFSLGVPLYLGVKVLFFWKLTWALEMKKPTEQSFHKGLSFNDGSQIFPMKFEAALVLDSPDNEISWRKNQMIEHHLECFVDSLGLEATEPIESESTYLQEEVYTSLLLSLH